jgi:hypothetical protein
MFFTMPFSTTASRRFLTFLDVMFTSLPPQVLSSIDLREGGGGGGVGQRGRNGRESESSQS